MRPPVAGERRVEHLAEPVDDDGLARLREDPAVDLHVVVRALGARGERAARHQDDPAADRLDERALLLVGGLDVGERHARPRLEVVGAGAAREDGARDRARLADRPADQLLRRVPVEAHPALRGVHGLGDGEAERPDVAPVGERRVPVQARLERRVDRRPRIGDDVHGGEADAAPDGPARRRGRGLARQAVLVERSVGTRQPHREAHPILLLRPSRPPSLAEALLTAAARVAYR